MASLAFSSNGRFQHRMQTRLCAEASGVEDVSKENDKLTGKATTSSSSSSASPSSSRRFFGEEWTRLSTRTRGGERWGCAYASLDDKRHFLFGGCDANIISSAVVLEYNSSLQNWHTHPPLPEARSSSTATAIDDDRFLIVGGSISPFSATNSCVVYDSRSKDGQQIGLVSTLAVVVTRLSTPATRKPT